jgi:hypothetical protein
MMLVRACEIVGIEDALVVGTSGWASRSALKKHFIVVIGVIHGLTLNNRTGLGTLHRFRGDGGAGLSGYRFNFQLVYSQMVLVLSVLTGDRIAQLLQALSPDAELLCNCLLVRVVRKEDEGLEGCIRIALLVDAPQDVVEEGLEVDRHNALG